MLQISPGFNYDATATSKSDMVLETSMVDYINQK